MDAIDRKILAVLQAEGRLTVTELAQRIGLSAAPCHRRLRELERGGVISGYRAVVDPGAVGHGFEVLLAVTMDREESVAGFEAGLEQIPEVVHAERLFGEPDYFVRVVTADIATFQRLRDERLARLPGVQRMTSTIHSGHRDVPAAARRAAGAAAGCPADDLDDRDEEGRGQPAAANVNSVETHPLKPDLSTDLSDFGAVFVEK